MDTIEKLINDLPNNIAENNLVYLLKKLDEDEVLNTLLLLLKDDNLSIRRSALRLVKRLIKRKENLISILDVGLRRKDISEIGLWLKILLPIIGSKALLNALIKYLEQEPELVILAWYYIFMYTHSNNHNIKKLEFLMKMINSSLDKVDSECIEYWRKLEVESQDTLNAL